MRFLLDTNIVSAHLKGDARVFNRFVQHSGGLAISVICAPELFTWGERGKSKFASLVALDEILRDIDVLPVDKQIAKQFGQTNAYLLNQGRTVPGLDLLIACTALVYDLTLVTHNTQDFANIPDLTLADWLV